MIDPADIPTSIVAGIPQENPVIPIDIAAGIPIDNPADIPVNIVAVIP